MCDDWCCAAWNVGVNTDITNSFSISSIHRIKYYPLYSLCLCVAHKFFSFLATQILVCITTTKTNLRKIYRIRNRSSSFFSTLSSFWLVPWFANYEIWRKHRQILVSAEFIENSPTKNKLFNAIRDVLFARFFCLFYLLKRGNKRKTKRSFFCVSCGNSLISTKSFSIWSLYTYHTSWIVFIF